MYTRYGHVNQVFVKVGDRVKLGQKIATNGTGNGQWAAHLHRDHPKKIPGSNFGFYNIGWSKEKTLEYFDSPYNYPKGLGSKYDHLGWDWLEPATYSTGKCFHPGIDENGKGSGNSDYDDPIYCVYTGTVVYLLSDGKGNNGGWGKLLIIEHEVPQATTSTSSSSSSSSTSTTVSTSSSTSQSSSTTLPPVPEEPSHWMILLRFLRGILERIFRMA